MVTTCSHKNYNSNVYKTFDISGNHGKDVNYKGEYFSELAPKKDFWQIWHDNIGVISEEENNKYYIEQYYQQVLSKLNPEEIYDKLKYSILLCYEDNTEFCHRHIVAEWFEILLDVQVSEIKVDGLNVRKVERPGYIRTYLEEVMKKNMNMRGFESLRALYLFEQGEKLEQKANELEKATGNYYDNYRQTACFYRCEADFAEEEYKRSKRISLTK